MKRILSLITALAICLGVLAFSGVAVSGAALYSGNLGTLSWSIDSEGALVIEGDGPVADFAFGDTATAWHAYGDSVKTLRLGDGVTVIGEFAFESLPCLTEISFGAKRSPLNIQPWQTEKTVMRCANISRKVMNFSLALQHSILPSVRENAPFRRR